MSDLDALLLTLTSRPAQIPPGPAAAALVEAGLAQSRPGPGGVQRYMLTEAGAARKQEALAARKAAEQARKQAEKEAERAQKQADRAAQAQERTRQREAERAAKAPARRTAGAPLDEARLLAGVRALLAEHREALLRELIEWQQGSGRPATPAAQPPAAPDAAAQILHALQRLDAQHRYDGLVPLRALRPAVPSLPRQAFDATLLDLEARRVLDLKIANDPVAVQEPEAGIRVDGRGLIYYVVRR